MHGKIFVLIVSGHGSSPQFSTWIKLPGLSPTGHFWRPHACDPIGCPPAALAPSSSSAGSTLTLVRFTGTNSSLCLQKPDRLWTVTWLCWGPPGEVLHLSSMRHTERRSRRLKTSKARSLMTRCVARRRPVFLQHSTRVLFTNRGLAHTLSLDLAPA